MSVTLKPRSSVRKSARNGSTMVPLRLTRLATASSQTFRDRPEKASR